MPPPITKLCFNTLISMNANRIIISFLFLTLLGLILNQKGFFIPEPVMAAECKKEILKSSKYRTHLIELYTSEGCSSCPPAEKWIASLRNNPNLGKNFFPLAFHVEYWDYIGWKDRFAKKQFSDRQRKYASLWNSKSIYTPGFVKNGKEWRSFPIRKIPSPSTEVVGALKATPTGKRSYKISFEGEAKNLNLNYSLLANGITSKVTRGENRGRNLKQFFAVLSHNKRTFKNGMTVEIPISQITSKEQMVAFWLDSPKTMEPLQVVGGCF
ncbi:MAG: DUF1223 domain-containing protein [Halobacteriovorax sp.]|nr:DUF1223 domain-containing protein [Halobacteriovorax sp.]